MAWDMGVKAKKRVKTAFKQAAASPTPLD